MAKRRKTGLSEIKAKKDSTKKAINPFNVHINRPKFNVLNRQLKTDRGLPGVSKAKALKKRKETLLQEYKIMNKSNKFYDRRIGEKNPAMTKEDRIIARFSAERMKSHRRKEIFNLADDEVLTHKGQSIAEIEKFDEPMSDGDEGDEKGLDANFVEGANFGGGVLKESKTNRASIIEQLIAESKKRKAEKQLARQKTLKKTEELDVEWKELIPIVNMGNRDEDEIVEKKDPYDIILGHLKFEPRGTPSDKLKTEAEIAEEEAHKLKELEEERLRRMRGEEMIEVQNKHQHRSADDLDDGFEIEENDFELTYDKDGNAIGIDKVEKYKVLKVRKEANSEESGSDSEEESEEEEGESEDDENEEGSDSAKKDRTEKEDEDTAGHSSADEEADDGKSDSGDSFSDLKNNLDEVKHDDSDDAEEDSGPGDERIENNKTIEGKGKGGEQKLKEKKKVSFGENVVLNFVPTSTLPKKTPEEVDKEKEERQKEMEKARKELPYAFEAPNTYEELQEVLKERTFNEQAVILERMIKCNHPSLNQKNKEKIENLFALILQHLNDTDVLEVWSLLDRLAPYLFDLAQFSPQNAAYCLREVILEKHNDYLKKKIKYPSLETFVFLKLIPLLFPTSDKRHSVTIPAFIFISEMLHQCQVTTRRSITSGLFLVSLVIEYVWHSKRFMPEVLNFLRGIIYLATPSTNLVTPPFKKEHKFLFLHKSCSDRNDLDLSMQGSDLSPKPGCKIDDDFRIRSMYCALKLTEILAHLYEGLTASKLLFDPIRKHLEALEIYKYPDSVQKAYEQLMGVLGELMKKKLEAVVMPAKKPKALRLYEPQIQPVYDSKTKNLPPEKAEHIKLVRKYRQEMKGAMREIRRDRQFISKVKLKEQLASDLERKRKVKEIYAWGAEQQSEFNKLKRKKKK